MPYRSAVSATARTTGSCSRRRYAARARDRAPGGAAAGARSSAVRSAVEVVDDVVRPAGEAVQRVHRAAALHRQQTGGQEVGPAVPGVEPPAVGVRGAQGGVGDPGGVQFTTGHGRLPRSRGRERVLRVALGGAGGTARDAAGDPGRGELAADEHGRDADAGGGAAAGQYGVVDAAHQIARAERAGLGEGVGGGEGAAGRVPLRRPVRGGHQAAPPGCCRAKPSRPRRSSSATRLSR